MALHRSGMGERSVGTTICCAPPTAAHAALWHGACRPALARARLGDTLDDRRTGDTDAAGTASWSDAVWQLVPAYVDETLVGLNGIPWWSWRLLPNSPALVQVAGWAPQQFDMLWLRTLADGSLAVDRPLGAALLLSALVSAVALLLRPQGTLRRRLESQPW